MLGLVTKIVALVVSVIASAAFTTSPRGVGSSSQTREDSTQTPVNPQRIKKAVAMDTSRKVLDSLLSSAAPALNAECFFGLLSAPLSEVIDTGRKERICCDVSGWLRRDPNGEGASLRGGNITVQLKFPFDPHSIHSDFQDKLKQMSPSCWFKRVLGLSKTKALRGVYQLELVISDDRLTVFSDSVRLPDVRRYYEWLPMQSEEHKKEFSEAFVQFLKANYDPTRWSSLERKISESIKLDPDFVELMAQSVASEEDAALLRGFIHDGNT